MREVVYNTCYGGFGLSLAAQKMYFEKLGFKPSLNEGKHSWDTFYKCDEMPEFYDRDVDRHCEALVATVKELGDKASGDCARLSIAVVEGPYRISEYDGYETVETPNDDYIY